MRLPILPKKSLGQHFLIDPNTARRIVAALGAPEHACVIEIGAGTGALTELLFHKYRNLEAIEIDKRAVIHLQDTFPDLMVRHMDVLKVDWKNLGRPPRYVIGNLPYNITSPILFGLLNAHPFIAKAILMVQREVADRVVAKPRTKAYGIPSVLSQLYAHPRILFHVRRNVFYPKPAVESSVIQLDFEGVTAPDIDVSFLSSVVRTGFGMRRKMLRNCFKQWKVDLPGQWEQSRAEELFPHDYVTLARCFQDRPGAHFIP